MTLKDEKSKGTLTKEKNINKEQNIITVKNYINGTWVPWIGTETVAIINPANKEIIGKCPLGTSQDIDNAVKSASEAFKTWREVPTIDRVQILFRLKGLLEKNFEDLAKMCTQENGETFVEACGDVRRGIQMIEAACGMRTLIMWKSF